MSKVWIVNASPVITLAKINRLDLLKQLADQVLLPQSVAAEIMVAPPVDAARLAVERAYFEIRSPTRIPAEIIEWGLGAGETGVLALAIEAQATAVLDDAAARTAARALNINLIGTLGVVLQAKMRGVVPSAGAIIQELLDAGLRLDDRLIRSALAGIQEIWPG